MPYVRRNRNRNNRRNRYTPYRKKNKKWQKNTTIQKGLGFSDGQIVKMRYVEEFELNPGIGTVASYIFRANGLYDPNYTGSGHQPYGFDQWMTYYNQFTVLGSKVRATFRNYNSSLGDGVMVGIQLKDSAVVDNNNSNKIIEQGRSTWRLMQPAGGTHDQRTLHKGFSTKGFFQARDNLDDIYRGSSSADPSEQAYFHIIAGGFNLSDDPAALRCQVIIDYIVKLNGPKPLVSS